MEPSTESAQRPIAPLPQVTEPLLTPPNRATRPLGLSITAPGGAEEVGPPSASLFTPGSRSSRGNVTPEQLQQILQDFEDQANATAAVTGSGQVPGAGDFFGGQATLTPSANTYRPSAVPKGANPPPIRDGRIVESLPSQKQRVMQDLGITEDTLEVKC